MTIIFHKEFLLQFVRWYYSMYKLSWHCQQQKCLLALSLVRHFEAGGMLRFLRTEWMTRFAEWNTSSLGVVFRNLSRFLGTVFVMVASDDDFSDDSPTSWVGSCAVSRSVHGVLVERHVSVLLHRRHCGGLRFLHVATAMTSVPIRVRETAHVTIRRIWNKN